MKPVYIVSWLFALAISFVSCDDWLDKTPKDRLYPDVYFKTEDELRLFTNQFYNNLVPSAVDIYSESSDLIVRSDLMLEMSGQRIIPDEGNGWNFTALRDINFYLQYSHNCTEVNARNRYDGVARFFRAYFYFEKVKRYGDIPWYDKALDSDDPELYKARDSREFVMQKMLEDLDFAIANLPKTKNAYVLTRWTALALKSRVCVLVNLNTGAIPTKEQAAVLAGNDAAAKAAIAKEFGLTVAYGLNTLQKDLKYGDLMDQMANNYKKVTTVVDKTDLLYAINSSVVTKKNEKNANLGAFKENVDKNLTNDRATQNIAVKGYASPDGPVKFNDTLSKKRSESGKKVVAKLLKDAGLDIDAAAYGEDWDGFKELVEKSDIKDKNLILQVLSLYNSPAERETEIKNMSTVFNELKKDILPELRRSQIVNSTDLQGLTDAEIMAAYRNGGDLTVEQYLYAAQELANGAEEQVAILTAASKKFNDARVWNNLGVAQTQAGDKAAALKSFEKAAKLDSSKELSKNLLLANLANGNTAEAKKYAAAADAQAKAAMAAAEGDYKAAAKNLEGYNAAIALVQSNDLAGAKKAIAKDNSADADYLRAVIAAKEGDLKTAEAQLKSAVSKNPALAQKAAKDINLKALKK